MQSEGNLYITNGITLPVNGTNADTPRIGTVARQLGYIIGHFAISVAFAFPIDILDILNETHKIGYNELLTKSFGYQYNVLSHNSKIGRDNVLESSEYKDYEPPYTYALKVSRFKFCVSAEEPDS